MSAGLCPFCAIAAGDAPASVVVDDGIVLAFMDQRQAVAGHVLVIPRRHVADIYALSPAEAAAVMQTAVRIARALRAAVDAPGMNLWQSNGEAGGQEVDHFHLHVHPRRVGDGLFHVYPDGVPAQQSPAELHEIAGLLRRHLPA